MENTISFTLKEYKALKKRYNETTNNNESSFVFDGNEYLTSYAKYVLEYLDTKFDTPSQK